ncbi:hypothetical protein NX801_17385 [Streptomyces sp. LP05-1]|uniref:DUF6777 domain-containing protein n=1 Tax=Streptomyces pyxinae TaxID=2970734 RepID=A0ABT2CJ16_9ACTN|nr:DUF6777 domain-containing protein [Streptomyces sp. LP05-1]MCS0637404.1 hypothetical protein [Streptomyces sp. LP05-1]
MRSPTRRRRYRVPAVLAVVLAGLLSAGCGSEAEQGTAGTERVAAGKELYLQAADVPGPDPFTSSTAVAAPAPRAVPPRAPAGTAPADGTTSGPDVSGATPGLYGGTRGAASCDLARQTRLLTEDQAKARAFAQAAGVAPAGLAGWLRGLTAVTLRADARVTSHGYRDGAAFPFHAVLQSGTAVLVDQYGAPRVRCACGNPLRQPSGGGGAVERGKRWEGYRPDRVITVAPTQQMIDNLIIADTAANTWIERRTGTSGDQDKQPATAPPGSPSDRDVAESSVAPVPVPTRPGADEPAGSGATAPGSAVPAPDAGGSTGADPVPQDPAPEPDAGSGAVPGEPEGGGGMEPDSPEPDDPGAQAPDAQDPEFAVPGISGGDVPEPDAESGGADGSSSAGPGPDGGGAPGAPGEGEDAGAVVIEG